MIIMSTTSPSRATVQDGHSVNLELETVNGKTKHCNNSTAPFTYTYGSVCLLCLKTKTCTSVKSEPEKHRQGRLACIKYVVLLSRYLKLDTELTRLSIERYFNPALRDEVCEEGNNEVEKEDGTGEKVNSKVEADKFVICDGCIPLAESFCKMYQDCELLRIKLEAKVLETASCVTKSEIFGDSFRMIRGLKPRGSKAVAEAEKDDLLIGFRNKLKLCGSSILKRSGPRPLLKRDKKADEIISAQKIPKLSSSSEDLSVRAKEEKPWFNQEVKIIRRVPGAAKTKAPDISIVRLPKEKTVENDSNNNKDQIEVLPDNKDDIQILDVLPKPSKDIKMSNSLRSPVAPSSCSSSSSGSIALSPNPSFGQQQTNINIVLPISTVMLNTPASSTSSIQGDDVNVNAQIKNGQIKTPIQNKSPPRIKTTIKIQTCRINGCGKSFPKTDEGILETVRHLEVHGGLKCSQCTEMLETPYELMSHELKHEETNPLRKVRQGFQCPRCPHYSMVRTDYQEHFLERHLNTKIEMLKCNLCKRGFSSRKEKQYRIHMSNSHPNETKDDLSQCFSCMICRVFFKKKSNLWKHLKNDHRINCQDGPHKCPECSNSFAFYNLLELHREFGCESIERHVCPYPECNSSFIKEELIKKHCEKSHNCTTWPLPECPVCQIKFHDLSVLANHVLTHNGEQVKLVFPNGQAYQEPQVIPLDSTGISMSAHAPAQTFPIYSYESPLNWASNIIVPSSMPTPPLVPTPPPPIVSGSVSTHYTVPFTSSTVAVYSPSTPVTSAQQLAPVTENHPHASNHDPTQDIEKILEEMFEETNHSEQPLMDILDAMVSQEGDQNGINPDEDPFAWMLAQDFEIG